MMDATNNQHYREHYNNTRKRERNNGSYYNSVITSNSIMKVALLVVALTCSCFGSVLMQTLLLAKIKQSHNRSNAAISGHLHNDEKNWTFLNKHFIDRLFFRLFCMTRPCFKMLCNKIEQAIGSKKSKVNFMLNTLKT